MIPTMNIIAWAGQAPWSEQRQVEQDLIISRAIVELFADEFLRAELRFRGGTALNKLHFPAPMRYSEDIDLVRTTHGPIKPVLRRVREILQPWLGEAAFDRSAVAPKLDFRVPAEDSTAPLRLKIEINTRETEACDAPQSIPYAIENPWFTGQAQVATFSREEMLATKLRALMQRNKGRDLFDLSHALAVFDGLDTARVIAHFRHYLQRAELNVSRAEAERRMFEKLRNPRFLADMRPLLPPAAADALTDEAATRAFCDVFTRFVIRLPGEPWARTAEMSERFELVLDGANEMRNG
ncbi:MAG TPA: nucleotidyl transferase AbiEii/AbiGii toxin family protein [Steroidobacter sp.]|nr:nucleotidyl transferase AbiEii/AbiGii toxin family protein [Steroidobacter sp.]